MDSIVSDYWG